MKQLLRLIVLAAFIPISVGGCGGGSSSSRSGNVAVFATDGFRDDYDHVWVTIYKIEVLTASGVSDVVFDDPVGRVIDLKSLRDPSGQRFALLANASVRSGVHTRVRVTIGSTINLVPRGSTIAQSIQVASDVPRDGNGNALLEFALANPHDFSAGNEDVVIDFDLAAFAIANGKVRPSIKHALGAAIRNRNRHEKNRFSGIVSDLSGTPPDTTFILATEGRTRLTVVTNANTRIFNADGSPNPALSNGQRVKVAGTFDADTRKFVATEIRIGVEVEIQEPPEVEGAPSNINPVAGTFDVTVSSAEDFMPPSTTVRVVTTADTVFRSRGGVRMTSAEFFAALATAASVEVQGNYNSSTNTFTALRAKLDDEPSGGEDEDVEVRGNAVEDDSTAGAFTVRPIFEWEGFLPNNNSVRVQTTASTRFKNLDGSLITKANFFSLFLMGNPGAIQVKVEGSYAAGVITASEVKRL